MQEYKSTLAGVLLLLLTRSKGFAHEFAILGGVGLHFGDVVAVIPGENNFSFLRDDFPQNISGCLLKIV